MSAISRILGIAMRFIYDVIVNIFPQEPSHVSFYALTIIVATILIRLCTLPVTKIMTNNQKKMAALQPEIDKLQKKYKNDPNTLAMKQQQLMKEANYNPLGGCLPMIVQLIVLMAFYRLFLDIELYVFKDPHEFEAMNKYFFHIADLSEKDATLVMPIIAGVTSFLQSYLSFKNPASSAMQNEQVAQTNTSMMIIMPIMIFMLSRNFQSALTLYWIAGNIFSIITQLITNNSIRKELEKESK